MGHFRTGLLLFSLAMSTLSMAQVRGMGITSTDRAGLGTAAGAAAAANSLAFRNGGTFFGAGTVFPRPGFPHHHHFPHRPLGFNRWGGYWPAYYGGYLPFDYDYSGYDMNPGYYTGYVPGTFNSGPYAGYPYPPGYAAAPGNAPQASYYPSGPLAPPPPPQASAPETQASGGTASSTTAKKVTTANGPESVSEPTVLVFRDGHKREVKNYAIMGSTLFVLSGQPARIPIAELDVPETIRQNQSRGLEFSLPDQAQPTSGVRD
jgi:hypothetical protein